MQNIVALLDLEIGDIHEKVRGMPMVVFNLVSALEIVSNGSRLWVMLFDTAVVAMVLKHVQKVAQCRWKRAVEVHV